MQYIMVLETDGTTDQANITSVVTDAVIRAAKSIEGVDSARVTQIGTELQTPTLP